MEVRRTGTRSLPHLWRSSFFPNLIPASRPGLFTVGPLGLCAKRGRKSFSSGEEFSGYIVVQMDTDKPGSVLMCGFLHTPVSPVNFRRERVRADRDDDLAESGAQDPCRRR